MTFPQYRKLDDRSYYKIVSEVEMHEMQRLGKVFIHTHLVAQTFVDRNFISDLLNGDNGRYKTISEMEYESELCRKK